MQEQSILGMIVIAKLSTGVITTFALYILGSVMFFMLFYYIDDNITILLLFISLAISLFSYSNLHFSPSCKNIINSYVWGGDPNKDPFNSDYDYLDDLYD